MGSDRTVSAIREAFVDRLAFRSPLKVLTLLVFAALLGIAFSPVASEDADTNLFRGAYCMPGEGCLIFFPGEFGHVRTFAGGRKGPKIITRRHYSLMKILDERTLFINGRCIRFSANCFEIEKCQDGKTTEKLNKKFCRVPFEPRPDKSTEGILIWPAPLQS